VCELPDIQQNVPNAQIRCGLQHELLNSDMEAMLWHHVDPKVQTWPNLPMGESLPAAGCTLTTRGTSQYSTDARAWIHAMWIPGAQHVRVALEMPSERPRRPYTLPSRCEKRMQIAKHDLAKRGPGCICNAKT
jgi:hypothetical protein